MSRGFDPSSAKWRCFCFHLTTGTVILISVMMAFCTYGLLRTMIACANVKLREGIFWDHIALIVLEMLTCAFSLIASVVAIIGIYKRIKSLLLPYVVLQVVRLVVYLALVISGKLLDDSKEFDKAKNTSLFVISLVLLAFLTTFEIYQGYIIFRCYNYIKDELENEQNKGNVYRTVHKETIRRKRLEELRTKRKKKRQKTDNLPSPVEEEE